MKSLEQESQIHNPQVPIKLDGKVDAGLEPLSTSFKDGDKTPSVHNQQKTPNFALGHSQYSDEQQSSRDDFITKREDNADTPTIPFKPIEPEKCRAYHSMPEGLRRLLCSQCDHFGNVRYQLGTGKCRRYGDGKV